MTIERHPIGWWAERLKTPLSLARFGDGEFYCVQGKKGGNSHGCAYTAALRDDLFAIIEDEGPTLLKGMQRITPNQLMQVSPFLKGKWVDTEIFADELARGGLAPLFETLRTLPLVIISSNEKRKIPLSYRHFIETPRTNAHAEKDRIVKDVLKYGKSYVYLFACGMAAGTFVHALHGKIPGASFIDIGHIFDPFIGEASREYLLNLEQGVLLKNLQ